MRVLVGDFWGGGAAAVVALPAAIGFGVAIYEPLGQAFNAQGAMAGMVGATILGIVAAKFGGCQRLISAPCAPAAAVLAALALQLSQAGMPASQLLLSLFLISVLSACFQLIFGFSKLGTLIKFMPYPVVAGYLAGVGLIIVGSQTPKWLGVTGNVNLWTAITSPDLWRMPSIIVGVVAMLLMLVAPHITKRIPAVILALFGSAFTFFLLGFWDPALRILESNPFIVGPLGGSNASSEPSNSLGGLSNLFASIVKPWEALVEMQLPPIGSLIYPALTLAVLLSIDTLKTCIVLDTLTHSRHDSNKELIGQGLGNFASAILSGMPGAGTMGATLVNISSGARSSASGIIGGISIFLIYILFAPWLAWLPLASLGGILTVIGIKMIDRHSLSLIKTSDTRLDFAVIFSVALVAQLFSLIAATGVGILFAAILFLRQKISERTIRRTTFGNQIFSKNKRLEIEREVLEQNGAQTVILELQGTLFFGTANQLYSATEPYLHRCRYMILDLRLVQSVDYSAAHILEQIRDRLGETGGELILSDLPRQMPTGEDLRQYFAHTGILHKGLNIRVFEKLDDALEWIEEKWLSEAGLWPRAEQHFSLRDFSVFSDRSEDTLSDLMNSMENRVFSAGETIFSAGDKSNEIYFILRGEVRIDMDMSDGRGHHIASHHQGDFIGEMGFLDGAPRADSALAVTEAELLILSRADFDALAENHRRLASLFILSIAKVLAGRLRQANNELRVLVHN